MEGRDRDHAGRHCGDGQQEPCAAVTPGLHLAPGHAGEPQTQQGAVHAMGQRDAGGMRRGLQEGECFADFGGYDFAVGRAFGGGGLNHVHDQAARGRREMPRVFVERHRFLGQARLQDVRGRSPFMREAPGEQIIQGGPQAVEVALVRVGHAVQQLRRDKKRGADEVALAVMPGHAGKAEIHQLGVAVAVEHDIGGFDVAVDQSLAVQRRKSVGDIQRHPQGGSLVDRPLALELFREVQTGDQLHHQIGVPVRKVQRIDLRDTGMVELAGGAGLAREALARLGRVRLPHAHQLDRHFAAQRFVCGAIDGAHLTFADVGVQPKNTQTARHQHLLAAGRASEVGERDVRGRRHALLTEGTGGLLDTLEPDFALRITQERQGGRSRRHRPDPEVSI